MDKRIKRKLKRRIKRRVKLKEDIMKFLLDFCCEELEEELGYTREQAEREVMGKDKCGCLFSISQQAKCC